MSNKTLKNEQPWAAKNLTIMDSSADIFCGYHILNFLIYCFVTKAWFPLGSINSSPVHRLISSPKIFQWEHYKFIAWNSSPKIKGDDPAMKNQKVLILIAGSSIFICDLIKVSIIKEIPPILKIDLKFLFKIQMELFIRNTYHVVF